MPDDSLLKVDGRYAVQDNDVTIFADGYPILLIGQASFDDLNTRLEIPLRINRFRPNIVITGSAAFEEDEMEEFLLQIHRQKMERQRQIDAQLLEQQTQTSVSLLQATHVHLDQVK